MQTKTIKLTKKGEQILSEIRARKDSLIKEYNNLLEREAAVVEVILDANGIEDQPKSVRIDGNTLTLEYEEEKKSSC